ncbi:MAG: hypothetical protein PW791_05770 [Neorhizobium sp.]|nr:hypothetical protein [Neorhizobium sp.]
MILPIAALAAAGFGFTSRKAVAIEPIYPMIERRAPVSISARTQSTKAASAAPEPGIAGPWPAATPACRSQHP